MATHILAPQLGIPAPAHTLTKAAKAARRELAEWAARNPIRLGSDGKPTRIPLTRAEVVAFYVHPEPEILQHRIVTADLKGAALRFAMAARDAGYAVKATAWRGTSHPTWHAPSDAPVVADDYHGLLGDYVQVWVTMVDGPRVRVTWRNGRFSTAYIGNRWVATLTEAEGALS